MQEYLLLKLLDILSRQSTYIDVISEQIKKLHILKLVKKQIVLDIHFKISIVKKIEY